LVCKNLSFLKIDKILCGSAESARILYKLKSFSKLL
jgi:hypothetical protein